MNKKRLHKSRDNKKIFGVCGGLAELLNMDPSIIRIIVVIATILSSFGIGIAIYIACAFILPFEDE